jgi:hypothetical protein
MLGTLLAVAIILIVLSLVVWLISIAPIPGPFAPQAKWVLYVLAVIFAVVVLLRYVPLK